MSLKFSAAVERAVSYVYRHGRPVDAAELACHLGHCDFSAAVAALSGYRNADAGFGHALEPDVRHRASTTLATNTAMQTMVRLKVPGYNDLIQGAMRFYVETYDADLIDWPLVTEAAKAAPCAPWWKGYDPKQWTGLNPRAEVLSYFIRFDYNAHEKLAADVRRAVLSELAKHEPLEQHAAQCVARLLRTPGIDSTLERACREKLERDLPKLLPKTKEDCKGYVLKPLTIARRPNSVLAGLVTHAIKMQHEHEFETQSPDGSWGPAWSWSDQDPTAWSQAEPEWRSIITMLTASSLAAYGA